jgi:hypothetical protein
MPATRHALRILLGAILFAAFMFGLAAAPGFLSAVDSTVPAPNVPEGAR